MNTKQFQSQTEGIKEKESKSIATLWIRTYTVSSLLEGKVATGVARGYCTEHPRWAIEYFETNVFPALII
jgi:hypothetical protein